MSLERASEKSLLGNKRNKKNHAKVRQTKMKYDSALLGTVDTYYPTSNDMSNLVDYIDSLWSDEKQSTGIIKLIPQGDWNKKREADFIQLYNVMMNSNSSIEIREQSINNLSKGSLFTFKNVPNIKEYLKLSDKYELAIHEGEPLSLEEREKLYWESWQNSKTVTTIYASDLKTSKFIDRKEIFRRSEDDDYLSLLNINSQPSSLFNVIEPTVSGITLPWFYFGSLFSSFCWHVEDLYLYSINVHHSGEGKVWYSISHTDKDKIDDYFSKKYKKELAENPDFLHWITLSAHPMELIEAGITVFRTVQKPGEIIVTIPKGYHSGFSLGKNVGEAVNFSVAL